MTRDDASFHPFLSMLLPQPADSEDLSPCIVIVVFLHAAAHLTNLLFCWGGLRGYGLPVYDDGIAGDDEFWGGSCFLFPFSLSS